MINGLWKVTFKSTVDLGCGVVVLRDNRILGGDSGFVYVGEITDTRDDQIKIRLHVKQFNPAIPPVIPGCKEYDLDLSGSINERTFTLTGDVPGSAKNQLSVIGIKECD